MPQKWYHASPKRIPVGTVLTGVFAPSGPWEPKGKVFITADEAPHYTIIDEAVEGNWHIYEVTPLGKKIFWGSYLDEASCLSAQVVKYVGSARGIVSRRIRNIPARRKQRRTKEVADPNEILRQCVSSRVKRSQVALWNRARKNQS